MHRTPLVIIIALTSLTAYGQISESMELTIAPTASGFKGQLKLTSDRRELSVEAKSLNAHGSDITFSTIFFGTEIRFRGTVKDNLMSGIAEGFKSEDKVSSGTWSLVRGQDSLGVDSIAGKWMGAFILQDIPKPDKRSRDESLDFNANVIQPAYTKTHPRLLFDEAHNNADTADGRYRPFSALVTSDGYQVVANKDRFSKQTLSGNDILAVVNASGPLSDRAASPFTDEECDAVRDWVASGGALLLITDHAPFSIAAAKLAGRFGVELTPGFTIDKEHYDKASDDQTELEFTRGDGLVLEHPITRGRNQSERVSRIITYSGTSARGPEKSVAFLKLSDTARDVLPSSRNSDAGGDRPADQETVSASDRAQGVAFEFGKGRVVVLTEAAVLTAQVTPQGYRFGMNAPGTDNRRLALNIVHWLSGLF